MFVLFRVHSLVDAPSRDTTMGTTMTLATTSPEATGAADPVVVDAGVAVEAEARPTVNVATG